MKKLFSTLAALAAFLVGAKADDEPRGQGRDSLFPLVVVPGYIETLPADSRETVIPLGHELSVMLVFDLGGLIRNVRKEDLDRLHLSAADAQALALKNLEKLAASGTVKQAMYPNGPNKTPFIYFSDHWAASTCILLSKLYGMASKNLDASELCVSIPHREAMLIFPKGDAHSRAALKTFVRENESEARKPLTFELFELTRTGISELKD